VARFISALAARGYGVSNGYGRLKEQTFRIGHMGDHTVKGLEDLLGTMDGVLQEAGA
jgi:aspartate aminotransferase-like enzyme